MKLSLLFLIAFSVVTLSEAPYLSTSGNWDSAYTSVPVILNPNVAVLQDNSDSDVQSYQTDSTSQLIALVKDASQMVRKSGEKAFAEFRKQGSRWRQGETYIFVLDPDGNMLVHTDSTMVGKNQLELKDVNGKPIIKGLISAATASPDKPQGWYHYQWPVPGGLMPRWKSSYVQLVKAPSGKSYIVGSGMYNDRMEREFVVDMVQNAVAEIEKGGRAAFELFHDPSGPYKAKDAYVFVLDPKGVELVNPAFRNLEGRNLMDLKDTEGKLLVREMFKKVEKDSAGWVDYMWPKPGDNVSTQKSTYVSKVKLGDSWLLVGAGVYLADAPKTTASKKTLAAPQLMALVRDAAAELAKRGEKAYPEFRKKGTKWFQDDTYLFVWSLDGKRVFHAADPTMEGKSVDGTKDALGRPYGKMFMVIAASPEGEGWVHYVFPEPGDIFPAWKSSFLKRVKFPSGKEYLVGSGIYNMQRDKAFVEDVVNRAAALVEKNGKGAFDQLRDKSGPFYFMDTYVFVISPDGTELVNPAFPNLEGMNLMDLKDLQGKAVVKDEIAAAMKDGSAWLEHYWYKPGDNTPAPVQSFVKKVQHGGETYIVGSGFYSENGKTGQLKKE